MGMITHTLQPDSILHIYYLEGTIPKNHCFSHGAFVGNWEEEGFSFLFFLQPANKEVGSIITDYPHLQLLDEYVMTYEEWQGGYIGPEIIGRFVLQPSWEIAEPEEGYIGIALNAGVVFGNGAHPTTRDCLEAIEIACHGNSVATMLDLGTGTGVLALAAAKLGCKKCLAVDFNHLAAQTALANVHLNNLQENILVISGRAEELLHQPCDLLVANIHYAVMKDIVRSEGFLKQKWFVLSGLLNSEAEKIKEYLETQPVHILKHWHQNGVWNTFLGITAEK
jgi:ribosomal protein L11 methyltransferase